MTGVEGVLVVDKPVGPTSFEVVEKVRRAVRAAKAGHTGTLDPLASGVLAVCLNDATRLVQFLTAADKGYDAVITLGSATDSLDSQGTVTATAAVPELDRATLEAALATFRGAQLQTPPMVSAVKVDGKRLYELARAGEVVERQAREVTVHTLELVDCTRDTLSLHVECSKGFFVRVLADELAKALGTVGHLSALRRTRSGSFGLGQAVPLAEVLARGAAVLDGRLVSEDQALSGMPELVVSQTQVAKVRNGVALEVSVAAPAGGGPVRVKGPDGTLLAIASVERSKLKYLRVLAPRAT